jgi:molecular chaperone GrpE
MSHHKKEHKTGHPDESKAHDHPKPNRGDAASGMSDPSLTPWASAPVPPAAAAAPKGAEAAETVSAEPLAELKRKAQERDEYLDLLQRTRADYLNYIKRSQKERADSVKYGVQEFAAKVVAVMDDFGRAIASAETTKDFTKFLEGVRLIEAQFQKVLADAGITPIETVGKPFDPAKHEAIMQEENAAVPDGTIVEEFQRGFMLNDRVLRAARVKVARKPAAAAEEKETTEKKDEG